MKKYTLFIYGLLLFVVALFCTMPALAQQQNSQYALYNYRNDGTFNAWLNIDIDSITYSCIDTLGVEHDDVVVQEVWTPDSLYRIPMEAIDSIGFRAPAPVMREGLFYLRDYHATHTLAIDSLTLYFETGIQNDSLPVIGQTIITATNTSPFEEGFAGRVLSIKKEQDKIVVSCERVEVYDIFKKFVIVGKSSNDLDGIASARKMQTRGNSDALIEETDVIENINVPDLEMSILDGIFTVKSKAPKVTCGYFVYVDELIYSISADVYIRHEDLSFEVAFKYSQMSDAVSGVSSYLKEHLLGEIEREYYSSTLEEYLKKGVTIPLKKGVLNLSLRLAPQIKIDGELELDIVTKTSARQHIGFKAKGYTAAAIAKLYSPFPSLIPFNPLGSITNWNYNYVQDPVKSTSLSAKATGSAKAGFLIQLEANLISKNVIHASVGVEGGRKLSGTLQFNIIDFENPVSNFYDVIKDTKITLKNYAKIKGEIGASPIDFWTLGGEIDLYDEELGKYYVLPHFTKPELPAYKNNSWNNYHPLSLYSKISKDILFTCKPGIRIVDEQGEIVKEIKITDDYKYEVEWRYRPLEINISDLEPNKTYRCYPTFCFFGSHYFEAGPVHKFTVPSSITASPSELKMKVGSTEIVEIFGGWDTFATVISGKEGIVSLVNDGEPTARKIKIYAEKVGTTTLQIEDRRTGEKLSVPITVTDGVDTQSTIKVEPEKIDFGVVEYGNDKKEIITVTNTGDVPTTFAAFSDPDFTEYFEIADNGRQFTIEPLSAKKITIICHGMETSHKANTDIFINANNGNDTVKVSLSAVGMDSKPLVEPNTLKMSVGEKKNLSVRTDHYRISNNNPNVVSVSRGGSSGTSGGGARWGEYDYNSRYSFGTGRLEIEALAAGTAKINITDEYSGKESVITIIVSEGSTVSYLTCPDDNHPHAIDLGLPSGTLWACCNVGASKPEDCGGYYAWGEVETKDNYSWDNYVHCDGTMETVHDIGADIAGTEYDVAHVKWGGDWCMPTKEQCKELIDNTTQIEVVKKSDLFEEFKSKTNGATIILWKYIQKNYHTGNYWTSSLNKESSFYAWYLYTDDYPGPGLAYQSRYYNFYVRPVCKKKK